MLYGERRDMRNTFVEAWRKHQQQENLTAVEHEIVALLYQHPEYQALMENPERALEQNFHSELGDSNPFAHLSMHLAIAEQIRLDRPHGIRTLYQNLLKQQPDEHAIQHRMMQALSHQLWSMIHEGNAFDDKIYLRHLREIGNGIL